MRGGRFCRHLLELIMDKPTLKPSQVLRKIKAGEIADPQPRGEVPSSSGGNDG
jgi:hypothetical protein